jgi:hypothetical protein
MTRTICNHCEEEIQVGKRGEHLSEEHPNIAKLYRKTQTSRKKALKDNFHKKPKPKLYWDDKKREFVEDGKNG